MLSNFMDSRFDHQVDMFTNGQITRMRNVFNPGGIRQHADFAEGVQISVTEPICTTRSMSVPGLPANYSVTSWSSSNTSGLTVNSSGTATRQNNFDGFVTVTATVTKSTGCNSAFEISKEVWVGEPTSITGQNLNGGTYYSGISVCPGSHYVTVTPVNTGDAPQTINWTVQSGISHFINGNLLNFTMPSSVTSVSITATPTNACGSGPNTSFYITKNSFCRGYYSLMTYPNPASDELSVEIFTTDEAGKQLDTIKPDKLVLFNEQGKKMLEYVPSNSKTDIDVSKFEPGKYFLHVYVGEEKEIRQIIIE